MKRNLDIFLISGKARHGKTTIGNMIKEYYASLGKKAVLTSFNKYIKMYACEVSDWDGNPETKPRTLLQELGTEIIREKLGKNEFFIKRIDEDMDVYNEFSVAVIIDDVRLPIEMEYFKEKYSNKVICIHVDRPNFVSDLSEKERAHQTEVALDNYTDYDYLVVNDGSLDDLREKIINIMKEVK